MGMGGMVYRLWDLEGVEGQKERVCVRGGKVMPVGGGMAWGEGIAWRGGGR